MVNLPSFLISSSPIFPRGAPFSVLWCVWIFATAINSCGLPRLSSPPELALDPLSVLVTSPDPPMICFIVVTPLPFDHMCSGHESFGPLSLIGSRLPTGTSSALSLAGPYEFSHSPFCFSGFCPSLSLHFSCQTIWHFRRSHPSPFS